MSGRSGGFIRALGWGRLTLLAGVLAVVFMFSVIIGMRIAVRGSEVESPALIGTPLEQVQSVVSRLGLKLKVAGRRYDPSIPEGAVITQLPGSGVGVKAGGEIQVILSLGKRINPIPELTGNSLRASRLLAEQATYQVGLISEVSTSGTGGQVLAQWPQPGSETGVDNRIDVLVGIQRAEAFLMPELLGQNLNRVLAFLERNGFEAKVFYQSGGGRRGEVTRQFPEPGYPLRRGETVNLEVAR